MTAETAVKLSQSDARLLKSFVSALSEIANRSEQYSDESRAMIERASLELSEAIERASAAPKEPWRPPYYMLVTAERPSVLETRVNSAAESGFRASGPLVVFGTHLVQPMTFSVD